MLKLAERNDGSARASGDWHLGVTSAKGEAERLVAALRRQLGVIIFGCVLGLVIGVGYILTAVPQFTGTAALLLDNRRVRAVQDVYEVAPGGLGLDTTASAVDSQLEVIKSDAIALSVVEKLELNRNPEFLKPHWGIRSFLSALIPAFLKSGNSTVRELEDVPSEEAARNDLANALRARVQARRVPRTLVMEIQYTSPDPQLAAQITNGFADAYLLDQLNAKYDATRRASDWLQNRLAELKQNVLTSDLAVQKFRAQHELVSTGGKLVSEQQLGEVNTQLVTARADTARAEARYDRIRTIIEGHQTDAVVSEAIGNNIIEQLRSKFVNAAKREAEFSAKLGPNHGSVQSLRNEMREYERLMFEELGRIAEVYRSELDIARSREKSLQESLTGLVDATAATNETLVALRELERESESYKELYKTFLQRHQEIVQQQTFPITEARIIMRAQKPVVPSEPKKFRALALMLVLGGGFGICLGALREFRDRGIRTGERVRDDLGLEFLGMLPYVAPAKGKSSARAVAARVEERELGGLPRLMRYVIDNPLSAFAETLRAMKIASDLTLRDQSPKFIGIVSVLPGEGKSTISMNFAQLLANLGHRTLLIDADLRNPDLTRTVAPTAREGIVEAVLEGKPIKDLMLREPGSSLMVLPAVLKGRIPHTSEFLTSVGMTTVLKQAGDDFVYIVIDLPPLGPVVDVRAFAPQLDGVMLVVEWGRTPANLLRATLAQSPTVAQKCIGVVLNKVAMNKLRLYQDYGSENYYGRRYTKYYHQ
jgi:succinoglycan biosynthesis transport protein ExoP